MEQFQHTAQQFQRADPSVGRISVWKVLPDISFAHRAKNGICYSVTKYVRIRVAVQSARGGNRNSAQNKRTTFDTTVNVITDSRNGNFGSRLLVH